ncbi:MAG: hypothetical protein A3H61_01780 [Candidatus Jacksonbacteria bacterium RIFCSPLOWO2_02_FULL_44_20]|uniref:LVIVD repeat protein n=1 Tax=Candidatus Jacksonbacteria bacterium RIFCSPLOWO2_02_FULL_44_20 TaxID=1798460 RepID=A0A1G2A919_9BACT|nr:MAG: hypothetical protein A3H61_01780 [Candidatus Jacksonbacteria bacterium RIFCSPLOWO2_02_FULL_44_20]
MNKNLQTTHYKLQTSNGFSLVEVILASAIFVLLLTALVGAYLYGQESTALAGNRARAALLAEEGLEAVRNIRDADFSNLADGAYGLTTTSNQWNLSGSSDATDIFTRQLTISSVDAKRKSVTANVSWQQNPQRIGLVSFATRFTNWLASGIGNWSLPALETSYDLTTSNSGNGGANALSIAFANNYVYLGRAKSGGKEFYIFDVSNPAIPNMVGSRDLNGDPNDIVISGNYAYIASTDNSEELQILDVSDPSAIQNAGKITVVDLTALNSGNNSANAIALTVSGTYLYMARAAGDPFLIFDLSNPANPGNPIGRTATVTGSPTDVQIAGNYGYLTSDDNNAEFQVVDISVKTLPVRVGFFDLNLGNGGADAKSLILAGNYAIAGRVASAAPELYSINITNPLLPGISSTLELDADVRSISYDPSWVYAFLATNDNSNDLKIIDLSNPASLGSPPPFGQLDINNSPQQIVYEISLDRAFVASSDNTQELQVIKPQ